MSPLFLRTYKQKLAILPLFSSVLCQISLFLQCRSAAFFSFLQIRRLLADGGYAGSFV